MPQPALIGREFELGVLAERLEAVRRARGSTLILRGDPGLGKTALADATAAAASADCMVLRVAGIEADVALPFAGLRRLLAPAMDLVASLPDAQQRALGTALETEPPTAHDRFAVPAALLGLLREAAATAPVAVIVDDLQWIDDASREAILFAARRVAGLRVAFLCTTRAARGDAETARLEQHTLAPLRDASARELLQRTAPWLRAAVAGELLGHAAGNPLALLELPQALTRDQREGRAPLDITVRQGAHLGGAFTRQLSALPGDTVRALAVAAALDRGPLAWLLAAMAELDLPEAALAPAERAGVLVHTGDDVGLRHALLRTAAYHLADETQRAAAHRALAATTDDPRRRAWHLAAAATRADDAAAGALDEAARRSRAVGGHAEAAAASLRAAQLSADPADRAGRELDAARDFAVVGRVEQALALLDAAEGRIGPGRRGELTFVAGSVRARCGDPLGALRMLTAEAERQLAAGDGTTATTLMLEAVVAQTMNGDEELQRRTIAVLSRVAAGAQGPVRTLADLTVAQDRLVDGDERGGRVALDAARGRLRDADPLRVTEPLALTVQCLIWADDHAAAEDELTPLLNAIDRASALGRRPYPLSLRATLQLRRGDTAAARQDAEQAVALARDTGQETMLSYVLTVLARAAALQGDVDTGRAAAAEALDIATRRGAGGLAAHGHAALGFAELAAGRPAWAVSALERSAVLAARAGFRHPAVTASAADLVEALLLEGRRDEAAGRACGLAQAAASSGNRWAAAASARCEVLLNGDDARVDALTAVANERAAVLEQPFEQGRTALAVGFRLRTAGRRADARAPLQQALDAFVRIGAVPWARRTRQLQRAVGERPAPSSLSTLDPEAQRIVLLVTRGLTNPEVGAALHVSRKTVERRLTAIYAQLGVRSRTELAAIGRRDAAGDAERH
ncbi:hypothetical protein DSM112329_02484 [Paraconexibacter sp. AEG42_29]|uniref:HTH luxR-type domain-containing protein n=1 Tax=Paraconexibacter sp. AEG42_29 TaxID=2997339 RepID=A0AAU7AVB0_9ACTN